MVAWPLANLDLSCLLMRRLPPRLRGSSRYSAYHNQIREMVGTLRPVRSANTKLRHTTGGTVREGQAKSEQSSGGSGQAVWL